MNKLKMCRVEGNARDQPFGRLLRVILPVTDDRMADCRKLCPDLILQSSHQRDPDQRRTGKTPLDGISKFGASRRGVPLGAHLLEHSGASKIMNQDPLLCVETPAKNRQILSHWRMIEKLSNQYLSIGPGFGEKQNAGCETIDSMDNKSQLSLPLKSLGKQGQSGWTIGALDGHSRQASRLIEHHHGIVLVKHGKLLGKPGISQAVAVGPACANARLSWRFPHLWGGRLHYRTLP